jgi:hypothetical protein
MKLLKGMWKRFTITLNRESVWNLRLPNKGSSMSYDYSEVSRYALQITRWWVFQYE